MEDADGSVRLARGCAAAVVSSIATRGAEERSPGRARDRLGAVPPRKSRSAVEPYCRRRRAGGAKEAEEATPRARRLVKLDPGPEQPEDKSGDRPSPAVGSRIGARAENSPNTARPAASTGRGRESRPAARTSGWPRRRLGREALSCARFHREPTVANTGTQSWEYSSARHARWLHRGRSVDGRGGQESALRAARQAERSVIYRSRAVERALICSRRAAFRRGQQARAPSHSDSTSPCPIAPRNPGPLSRWATSHLTRQNPGQRVFPLPSG